MGAMRAPVAWRGRLPVPSDSSAGRAARSPGTQWPPRWDGGLQVGGATLPFTQEDSLQWGSTLHGLGFQFLELTPGNRLDPGSYRKLPV